MDRPTLARIRMPAVALAFLLGAIIVGCEKNVDMGSVDAWLNSQQGTTDPSKRALFNGIAIDPAEASVTEVGQKVVFRAKGGEAPYRWETANGNGVLTVKDSDGDQAVYTAQAIGYNAIMLTDRKGHQAIATVNGENVSPLTVTADPASLSEDGDMAILEASGGTPPYTWTVVDASLGHIVGSDTGNSVVYIRDHSGDNAVTCQDSAGQFVHVLIAQPAETAEE